MTRHIIYAVVTIASLVIFAFYTEYLIKYSNLIYKDDESEYEKIYRKAELMNTECSAATTVIQLMMIFGIKCSKSLRFYGFHADYGHILNFVISVQIILICLSVLFDSLYHYNESFHNFWHNNGSLYSLYRFIDNLFFIVPMMSQLSCLIFGYFRHK